MTQEYPHCPKCNEVVRFDWMHCPICESSLPWAIGVRFFADIELARNFRYPFLSNADHDLLEGKMEIVEWKKLHHRPLVESHFASAAVGRGEQLSLFSWDKLRLTITQEFTKLNDLAIEISNYSDKIRKQPLDEDVYSSFMDRMSSIEFMASCTYKNMRLWHHQEMGFEGAARVCGNPPCCDLCRQEEKRGLLPIADVLPLGETEVGGLCNCDIFFYRHLTPEIVATVNRQIPA